MHSSRALIFLALAPFVTNGQLSINLLVPDPRAALAAVSSRRFPPLSSPSSPPSGSIPANEPILSRLSSTGSSLLPLTPPGPPLPPSASSGQFLPPLSSSDSSLPPLTSSGSPVFSNELPPPPPVGEADLPARSVPSINSVDRREPLQGLVFVDANRIAQRVNTFWTMVGGINEGLQRRPRPICRRHVCHDISVELQRQCCDIAGVCCHRHSLNHYRNVHEPVAPAASSQH